MLELLAGIDDATDDAHDDVRRVHARRYLLIARPTAMALSVIVSIVQQFPHPSSVTLSDFWLLGLAVALISGAGAAALRFDPLRVAAWMIPLDAALVVCALLVSEHPDELALLLMWPIVGAAYFATAYVAIALVIASAVLCMVLARTLATWDDTAIIPSVAIGIVFCGSLIAFVLHQGRLAELRLARERDRVRRALSLSRRVHFALTPREALDDIAREVGVEFDAGAVVVALLDLDESHATDVAAWNGNDQSAPLTSVPVAPALCELAARGLGALVEGPHIYIVGRDLRPIVAIEDVDLPAVESAVRRLLAELGQVGGVLVPLALGNISVGIMAVARTGDGWQTGVLRDLEPATAQLAAGLAQATLVRDQRETLEQLERVDRMRDRLLANVSHELRTPLTSTIGFIETLLRDDLELDAATRNDLMVHARDGGLRLVALVDDLLALGSTRPEILDLAPAPIAAHELVEAALRGIELPANRSVVCDICSDTRVVVDRNRILQVLTNLLTNAVRHGAGNVTIRVSSEGDIARFDVVDEGPGVLQEHLHELFLPFARFSTRTDSTGLGLAICRTIVEAHGGTVDYARIDRGRRTRFRVRLPAALAN